jgi:UDP-3-O-[3-hydroxymyristoyl] glucosamine N-acyltransferase
MTIKSVLEKYSVPTDIEGTCGIQDLKSKFVTYVSRSKFVKSIREHANAYILVNSDLMQEAERIPGNVYIEVPNATQAFVEIHNEFHRNVPSLTVGDHKPIVGKGCKIDATARFGEDVNIGNNVEIQPHVVIGSNSSIDDDTKIFANATIYDRTRIGKRCIIDSNACIGGDGFRIITDQSGMIHRLIHIGGVVFGDDVEFGNGSCVDRGSFGNTILERNVKIDNLVHIGHNAHIKENTSIAAVSCIGGSAVIGRNCWIGIGVTISNGLAIGDDSAILINAVVTKDVPEKSRMSGFFAMPHEDWIRFVKSRTKK